MHLCDWLNMHGLILIAEDNEDDSALIQMALARGKVNNPVRIVSDGAQVVAYLKGEPPYADRKANPFPRLLLLDIKMPILSGFEVLNWIRSHTECSVIPTIVMSTSKLNEDIERAYRMGANAYIAKPAKFDDLVKYFTRLAEFWAICEVPPLPARCS